MSWLARKLDTLVAAVICTGAGMVASQTQAFIQQYLQRLGGHVDEARLNLQAVLDTADPINGPAPDALGPVVARIQERVDGLEASFQAISAADSWGRPLAFLQHVDRPIAEATLTLFQPALPLSPDSLVFTLAGIVMALVAYEIVKLPLLLFTASEDKSRKKRRIFEPRGDSLT